MRALVLGFVYLALQASGSEKVSVARRAEYFGLCDASAAVAVTSNVFAVASDEDNILRLYRTDRPGRPIREFDLDRFLGVTGRSLEADLEGAARIGDRAYWIGSHALNRRGKERLNRCRFFATDIRLTNGEAILAPVGQAYTELLNDLLHDAKFAEFHLATAARYAPKEEDALNIEGLAATAEGHLLIGFRNPIPGEKALVIPLLNPNEVIQGKTARFGTAILLNLGGLGIRDMLFDSGKYLIVGGAAGSGGKSHLYRWGGGGSEPELLKMSHLGKFNPEAITVYPSAPEEIQLLSDDGNRVIDDCPCKLIKDPHHRVFRSVWLAKEGG
jgi:hypothetical protein